jgi:hypothetical protein
MVGIFGPDSYRDGMGMACSPRLRTTDSSLPFALCLLPSAFCPLPFALCPLRSALCPLPASYGTIAL